MGCALRLRRLKVPYTTCKILYTSMTSVALPSLPLTPIPMVFKHIFYFTSRTQVLAGYDEKSTTILLYPSPMRKLSI